MAGTLAVVLSSVAFSCGTVIGQRSVSSTPRTRAGDGGDARRRRDAPPLRLLARPTAMPDGDALLSLLALALVGTALAQFVLYRTIRFFGGRRMSLVTYLMPGFALAYGAVLLEPSRSPAPCLPG